MKEKYVAFLRGINVGGHHKVPMADLRLAIEELGFKNVTTLLNSGNVIFEAKSKSINVIEQELRLKLAETFGFDIPVVLRTATMVQELFEADPFRNEALHKDIRWYVSLLKTENEIDLELPWTNPDKSFKILELKKKYYLQHFKRFNFKNTKGYAGIGGILWERYNHQKLENN
jgi:uncharacterized protein (DUF1697 family)